MRPTISFSDNQLSLARKEEMWNLYQNFYHYSRDYFMQRIERNTHFVFHHLNGDLVGFSGMRINKIVTPGGQKRLLVYYGQTVLDPIVRGKSLMQAATVRLCMKHFNYLITGRIIFWCDALTYKSYLLFARSLDVMYPSRKQAISPFYKEIRDIIGDMYYQNTYDAETGVIHKPTNYVKDTTVKVYERDLSDPDVQFFATANPKHEEGNGLLTLGPIDGQNFYLLIKRYIQKYIRPHRSKTPKTQTIQPKAQVQ
jgi:hypothetical protein